MCAERRQPVAPLDLAPVPHGRFLTNGRYTVLVTAAGSGFSTAEGVALTPWSADAMEVAEGFQLFGRDLDTGSVFRIGSGPAAGSTGLRAGRWSPGRSDLAYAEDGLEIAVEVCVAPDSPAEVRRVRLWNHSGRGRRIELTTYVEVALSDPAAHRAHPAFSKLFLATEFAAAPGAILVTRRARARGERHPWLVHALLGSAAVEHETDRALFLGRGHGPAQARALRGRGRLSGTTGAVLDPIASLRTDVLLPAGGRALRSFLLGVGSTREAALDLAGRWPTAADVDSVFDAAGVAARAGIARLEIEPEEAADFEALAAAMLQGHPGLRSSRPDLGPGAELDPAALGLDPRHALALLDATTPAGEALRSRFAAMYRYWRSLGLPLDAAVLASAPGAAGPGPVEIDSSTLSPAQRRALETSAAMLLPREPAPTTVSHSEAAPMTPSAPPAATREGRATRPTPPEKLVAFNGFGGFAPGGQEYVLRLAPDEHGDLPLPPRPWANVVANERFGFLVSETGAGCTWSGNSREHRLTPWANDPLRDPHGEALYVRDEDSGRYWSAWPGPRPGDGAYEVRHGHGITRCRHASAGLELVTSVFVPRRDPLKVVRLAAHNTSGERRRLSIFAYARLVLGDLPERCAPHVMTALEPDRETILARNPRSLDFATAVVFATAVPPPGHQGVHASADREEFLGPGGSLSDPAALRRSRPLAGRTGPRLDPCAAHQVRLDLAPGESAEVAFLLGEGASTEEARMLVARYRVPGAAARAESEVEAGWRDLLGGVRIETPAAALDLVTNGWLGYQTASCRLWGRTAVYQSGGAWGFRDQLQDAAALLHFDPGILRRQLLLHAAHQFVDGDVLHWWHPPRDRGIRTRFADDLLWLPHLTATYVEATGDAGVLDEPVPYLVARRLAPGEDEAYLAPERSSAVGSLYEHCCRTLDRARSRGAHGLPLFGTGDWNDGMNRVGREGRGESVWMGFFLFATLGSFGPLCARRGDAERARRCEAWRRELQEALERSAWDGEWYLRGFYDDGTPLGSQASDECRIDALVQAWAVLSGAAAPERAARAMAAVERHLVSESDGLVRLLWPPFDRTPHDPGYIKGYVPGIRENGGQYTHAALWVVRALAQLGRNDRAARLLEMLSPVARTRTAADVARYQVEPYVVAADVYGAPPHVGRGGWTWYTGSSGWMLRVVLESILGVQVEGGDTLRLSPCVPDEWRGYSVSYRLPGGRTRYEIEAANPHGAGRGVREARLDGVPIEVQDGVARVLVADDGAPHRIDLVLGKGGSR